MCALNLTGDHLRQMHKNCSEGVRTRLIKMFRNSGPDGEIRGILTESGFANNASGALPRSAIAHTSVSPTWSCGQLEHPDSGGESWPTGALATTAISGVDAAVAVNPNSEAGVDAVALKLVLKSPHSPAMARRPHMRRTRKADERDHRPTDPAALMQGIL